VATPSLVTFFAPPERKSEDAVADEARMLASQPLLARVLERIFFHDILNAAGGLRGILEMWPDLSGDEAAEMTQLAQGLSTQLIDEIRAQRDLASAERGDLVPEPKPVNVRALLGRVCAVYGHHAETHGKLLAPPSIAGDTGISTDEALLARVLGNLIKNALEASRPGENVTVAYTNHDAPTFTVHNQSVMSEAVQLQVFQRSFTTKSGRGHGIGTYSVKLLTERYLKGVVTFRSAPDQGTTFVVRLPAAQSVDAAA
jgi:signal transduction histidine kinase